MRARRDPEEQWQPSAGQHVEEPSQSHKGSVLVSVGCQTDEQEPEVMLLHLAEAPPLTHIPNALEDLRAEWGEWFGVQRTILGYLNYLGDHGLNPHKDKRPRLPHLRGIHRRALELLRVPRPRELPSDERWKGRKERTPSPDIQERPDYCSAEDLYRRAVNAEKKRKGFYKTTDQGRSRVPFWVMPEEWPAWKWDPVRKKHMRVHFWEEPVEDKPYWCPEEQWFNWKRDPALGWVPIPLEEMDQVYAEQRQRRLAEQSRSIKRESDDEDDEDALVVLSRGVKHERDDEDAEDAEGESSQMASKRVRLAVDTSRWTDVIVIE